MQWKRQELIQIIGSITNAVAKDTPENISQRESSVFLQVYLCQHRLAKVSWATMHFLARQ